MVSPTLYRAVGRGRQKGFRSHFIDTINSYRVVLSRSALSMSKTPVLTTESLKNADLASRNLSFTVSFKVSRPYAHLASISTRDIQLTATHEYAACRFYADCGAVFGGYDEFLYRGTENAGETALYCYYLFN